MASKIQKSAKTEGFGDEINQWVSRVTGYSSQYDENRSEIQPNRKICVVQVT